MKTGRIITVLLLAGLAVLAGCKKKPKTAPPPQAQAPVITRPQPQLPPTEPTQPPPQPPPPVTTPEAAKPPTARPVKPKSTKKPTTAKKTAPTTPAKPNKTVVTEGGAAEGGQLSAAIPHDEAIHQRLNTAQLLEATEANLKSITRVLSNDEQSMVQQIRSYLQQSRAATTDGDTERAYNLALKAHLLSDEFVKGK